MPVSENSTTSTVIYVGTYTGKGSDGIYKYRLNRNDGTLTPDGLAANTPNPSFLALSPDRRFLYCINEVSDFGSEKSGSATSFAIDSASGMLNQLDQKPSGGVGPCYIFTTSDGNAVLIANYGNGSVSLLATSNAGGRLSEPISVAQHKGSSIVTGRQDAPHAHCFKLDPSGRFAVAVDLGIDEIIAYRLAADSGRMDTSAPVITKTSPGAGPRHIAFHPDGKYAFVSNELSNTVSSWSWSADTGRLTPIQTTATVPEAFTETNYPGEVLASPDGKFVYLSNRGHNSVAVFQVDAENGKLQLVGTESTRGKNPRGMDMDTSGEFLIVANQDSDNLVVYVLNQQTGMPEFASEIGGINQPVDIEFLE